MTCHCFQDQYFLHHLTESISALSCNYFQVNSGMGNFIKWRLSGWSILFLVALVFLGLLIPVIYAENEGIKWNNGTIVYTTPLYLYTDSSVNHSRLSDPPLLIYVTDLTTQVEYWNARMVWQLSESQIKEYGKKMETRMAGKYERNKYGEFVINNYSAYADEMGSVIGLDDEQKLAFVYHELYTDKIRGPSRRNPGFIPVEIPHFFASGKVLDNVNRPVANATIRFTSDLAVDGTYLTSTAISDPDGNWRIKIAWGNHQNVSVTKDGYEPVFQEVTFSNETNVMDFTLIPRAKTAPVFLPVIVIAAVIGWLATRSRDKD